MASSGLSREFSRLFPEKIRLKLAKPKAAGIFRSVYNYAKQMVKYDDDAASVCQLTTNMVEVHPLVYGLERSFGALYGRDLLLSGGALHVIGTSEQLERRWAPSRRDTILSAGAINGLTLGLEAAIVG